MTTTPDNPLGDDEMTTEGVDPSGVAPAPGADADGTDGADADGTDGAQRRRRHRRRPTATPPTPTAPTRRRRRHGRLVALSALDRLTGDAQTFLDKVWASSVHVHRTDAALGESVLSLADVDHLLTETAIRAPAVRVAHDGSVLAESAFTRGGSLAGKPLTGLVDPVKLMRLHDEGATIVLQGLQRYWTPVSDLVAELELELGHPCQANAYLTPPGAQGFAVHTDSHDVFVLQTHGTKLWEIHGDGGPGELLLEPGVVAYLPTGTPHAARAQEAVSLHLTIGINQVTWRQLVSRLVGDVLAEVPDEHLPAGYLDDPGRLAEELGSRLDAVVEGVRRLDAPAAARAQAESFLTGRPPRLAGALLDREALVRGLAAETRLRRRSAHPCHVVEDGDSLRLLLGDRVLRVPARLREAVDLVAGRLELTPADLPLDAASALVLCRRLVREGLLEVVR